MKGTEAGLTSGLKFPTAFQEGRRDCYALQSFQTGGELAVGPLGALASLVPPLAPPYLSMSCI